MLPYIRFATLALLPGLALSACNCEGGGLVTLKPVWVATPEALEFGQVPVGDLRFRAFKIQNKSDVLMTIARFQLAEPSAEFSFVTPIPTTLDPQATLDFNVMFKPASAGDKRGTIIVEANDKVGHHEIPLHGIGVIADVIATPEGDACGSSDKSISFGRAVPGQTIDRTITVKAIGSAAVTIQSVIVEDGSSPAFSLDRLETPMTLAPGASLALHAHYAPTVGGTDSGAFVISTDAATNQVIRVTACGEAVAPAVCAMRLDLGNVVVGTTATGMLHVTSCGLEPAQLIAIGLATDAAHPTDAQFRISNLPAVPTTLAPMAAIDIPIEFTARTLGPAEGFVRVASNALGRPESFFPIAATGAQPCTLDVMPTTLNFRAGSGQRMQQAVLVQNTGSTACPVTRIAITQGAAAFQLAAPPATPLSLPPAGAVTLQVGYMPTSMGSMDHGLLEVDGGGVMKTVTLNGTTPPSGCLVDILPSVVNFGTVPPNDVRSVGIRLNNVSRDICFFQGASLALGTSRDFANTSPAFGLIPPGGNKTISVTYRPTTPGAATGTLVVQTTDVVNPRVSIPLFAASAPTGICVEPRSLSFGPTLGTNFMDFTIYACGARAVTVTGLDWTRPDAVFSLANPAPQLPFLLSPGMNRPVRVQFTSDMMRGHTAIMTVRSDDAANPAIDVTVTGGPQIVPESAGRFMYYWQIPNPLGGDIMKLPLQGVTTSTPWWGPRAGKGCSGCHSVSPDGRYVAVMEIPTFRIVDTTTNLALSLPGNPLNINFVSWNPNVHTTPPYQYAYDDGQSIHIASAFEGHIRNLQGASERGFYQMMPTWGRNGKIVFTRAMMNATTTMMMGMGSWGVNGPADLMMVDETGGTAVAIPGASGNRMGNYYPQFSPNGQWIAFTQSAMAHSSIAATDARLRLVKSDMSGTVLGLPQINGNQGAASYPTWSVDGAFLSFSSNRPGGAGGWDIYVAPVDQVSGADSPAVNVRQANTPAFEHSAQWSP